LHGLLALGGSCGTAIVSEAIQQSKILPIGLPKLIVSTVATRTTVADIFIFTSVNDT
ncbi:unnamed protein product, partial [Rotaria sp. Silwood2]